MAEAEMRPLSGSGRGGDKPQVLVERNLSLRKNFLKLKRETRDKVRAVALVPG
jgi:hypothetical protein